MCRRYFCARIFSNHCTFEIILARFFVAGGLQANTPATKSSGGILPPTQKRHADTSKNVADDETKNDDVRHPTSDDFWGLWDFRRLVHRDRGGRAKVARLASVTCFATFVQEYGSGGVSCETQEYFFRLQSTEIDLNRLKSKKVAAGCRGFFCGEMRFSWGFS